MATTTNTTTSVTVDANVGKEGVLVDAANPDIISSPSLSSSSSQLVLVERWKINHSSQLAASDEKTSILSQGDLETLEILRELRQLGTQELIDGARSDGEDDIEKDLMNEEVDISYLRKRRKHVDGMYELDEEHEEMEKDDNNNDNDQEDLLIDVFEEDEEQETLILEEMFLGSQAPVLITPDKKRHQSNQRTPLQFTTTSSQVSPSSPSKPSSSSSSASSPSASAHKNRKRKQEVVASNQLLTSPPQAPTSSLDFVFEEDDIEDDDDNLRFSPSRKRGRFNNIPQTDGADDDNDAEEHLITIPHKQAQLRSASPPPESNFPSTRLRHLTSSIQELWSPRQDLDGGGESFSNSGNFIRFTADMIGLGRDDYHEEEGSQFFHVNLSLPLTARPQVDKGETAVIPLPAKSSTKSTTSTLALPISHAPIGGDESDLDIPDLIISSSTDLLTRAASQLKSSVKTISSSSSASGHLQQQNHSPYSPFTSTNASSKFTSSNFASSSSSSSSISNNFENHNSSSFFIYTPTPPSSLYLETTASPQVIYQPPFFSKRVDYEGFEAKQYGNKRFTIPLDHVKSYPKADGNVYLGMDHWKRVLNWKPLTISASIGSSTLTRKSLWELARPPPCLKQVLDWLAAEGVDERKKIPATKLPPAQQYSTSTRNKQTSTVTSKSQLKLPTQLNTQGWKYSPIRSEKISVTKSNLVIMSVEVHVATRHHLQPDPDKDAILALVYCIKMDEESSRSTFAATDGEFSLVENGMREGFHVGAIVVDSPSLTSVNNPSFTFLGLKNKCKFLQVSSERALLLKLVDLVRIHDPDLLIGYEIHKASWGYVIERASRSPSLGMKNMAQQLSRMKEGVHVTTSRDQDLTGYYYKNQSIYRTSGRIFLNVWKEMKSEYNLLSYTLENVVFHVLHERIPRFSFKTLTDWYPGAGPTTAAAVAATGRPVENRRWKTLAYYIHRVQFTLCLIDEDTGYLNQVR